MVTGIQSLYDSRARIVEQMKSVALNAAKEGRAMSAEENQTWSKMEADEAALTATIQANEKAEQLEARAAAQHFAGRENTNPNADKGAEMDYRAAYTKFLRGGNSNLTNEERNILRKEAEKRGTSNQVVGTDSLGGYLVPDLWQPEIERAMLDYSGILQACRILRTEGGQTLYWPTEDDTTTKAVKVGEASQFTVQDLTFGTKQLDAYKYGSLMKVKLKLS